MVDLDGDQRTDRRDLTVAPTSDVRIGGVSSTDRDKAAWRRWARVALPAPSPDVSRRVVDHLAAHLNGLDGDVITYRPMRGEVSLDALIDRHGPRLLTTRTPDAGPLTVHRIDGPTERHRFGFEQPAAGSPEADRSSVGAVLVPAVLFGRDGTRLGHGAGYYDRLLPTLPASAQRIAVSWSAMTVAGVPTEAHDVPMTHLVTEHGIAPIS